MGGFGGGEPRDEQLSDLGEGLVQVQLRCGLYCEFYFEKKTAELGKDLQGNREGIGL